MPKLAKNPTPQFGQLDPFFWTSKRHFARMTEKSTDDDNDDCNDNYDSNNDGNFYDNDDKNDQKTYKYHDFSAKYTNFRDFLPHTFGQFPKVNDFFLLMSSHRMKTGSHILYIVLSSCCEKKLTSATSTMRNLVKILRHISR